MSSDDKISVLVDTWRIGLEGVTGHEFKVGMESAVKWCKWPPSPAEFREYCRPPKPRMQAYHGDQLKKVDQKVLENPANKKARADAMAEINKMLGRKA